MNQLDQPPPPHTPTLGKAFSPATINAGVGNVSTLTITLSNLDSRLRYAHAIWHLFVIAGTGFHFFAVLGYAA